MHMFNKFFSAIYITQNAQGDQAVTTSRITKVSMCYAIFTEIFCATFDAIKFLRKNSTELTELKELFAQNEEHFRKNFRKLYCMSSRRFLRKSCVKSCTKIGRLILRKILTLS